MALKTSEFNPELEPVVQAVPPHEAELPPMKFPLIVKLVPEGLSILRIA